MFKTFKKILDTQYGANMFLSAQEQLDLKNEIATFGIFFNWPRHLLQQLDSPCGI